MQARHIDVLPLITHRFAFADAAEHLPLLHQSPGLVKAIIDFDSSSCQ
jgi:hypothetical protein